MREKIVKNTICASLCRSVFKKNSGSHALQLPHDHTAAFCVSLCKSVFKNDIVGSTSQQPFGRTAAFCESLCKSVFDKKMRNLCFADYFCVAGRVACLCILAVCVGCRIEPPLHLAEQQGVMFKLGEVVTDLNIIWDIDADWRGYWYYGWDEQDEDLFGKIEYPMPTNYEGRFYFLGSSAEQAGFLNLDRLTIYENTFHRRFDFGYHNILVWSNIDSEDGTQTLIIDESDEVEIHASTSRSRLGYRFPESRSRDVYNAPEIFYSGGMEKFYVSRNVEDYDYFDPELNMWVKESHTVLTPLVYMYLVQVIVYNNNGRIVGVAEDSALDNVADGVSVRTGRTTESPVVISFPMRLKHGLDAPRGTADIFGSKLTTFGLCGMDSWSKSRWHEYDGSRADLRNRVSMCMNFSNSSDSVYLFDVTRQMQQQAHGGVLTIEIDCDTLRVPQSGSSSIGAAFDPTIEAPDSISHEFPI